MNVLKQLEKAVSSALAKIGIISTPNEKLKEIVSLLPITYDDENEELEKKAFEIINEDGFEDYINNEVDNSGQTILDFVLKCDSQGEKRLNNSALTRLEQGIRILGGKKAEKLEQKLGENIIFSHPFVSGGMVGLIPFVPMLIGARVGQRLDVALGLPERTPIFEDILGMSLLIQTFTVSLVLCIK